MEDTIQPNGDACVHFGVRVVEFLGGRLNKHWLVERGAEQLVLRRWAQPADSIAYELHLLERLAALGWPVAPAVAGPVELADFTWSLAPLLPGEPPVTRDRAEQRARGRLLAHLHADLAGLTTIGQRRPWRRCEEILSDQALDEVLRAADQERPDEVRVVRWHLERARERVRGLPLYLRPGMVVHGDFTPWNLRFCDGQLSGILDFELAHWDHRVADFALAWRGAYDDVVLGYDEASPLEPEEWALLTPMWWAYLVEAACQDLRAGTCDDGWILKMLLRRSPLMGPDATPFR